MKTHGDGGDGDDGGGCGGGGGDCCDGDDVPAEGVSSQFAYTATRRRTVQTSKINLSSFQMKCKR